MPDDLPDPYEEDYMTIWWCQEHESRGNPTLDAGWDKGEYLEMWAGCHDSLWSFASGMGDGGKEDKVGRCRMVPMRLIPDDALETVWFCWLHKSAGIPGEYVCEMAGLPSFVDSMLLDGLDPTDPKYHQMVEVLVLKPALDGETP